MLIFKNLLKNVKSQTAIELSVFGAVVIFLVGLMVREVLSSSYQQGNRLKGLRMAMLVSFEYSEGLKAPPGNWQDGTASRNNTSILIIEDRLTAQSARYGAIDRTPYITQGTAVHSRNLFMPVDPGEYANLPIADFFVNGIHFPLTMAGLDNKPLNLGVFKKEFNHPETDWCNCAGNVASCADNGWFRFDLNRNGFLDDGVTDLNCGKFMWQWRAGTPGDISVDDNKWTNVDIDRDLFTEQVIGKNGTTSVDVMDFQQGDMFFGDDESRPTPGFASQDVQMFTFAKNTIAGTGGDGVGTYLLVDEGKLFETNGDTLRYVRSAQRKDSIDIVQRVLQLSLDTGRFCSAGAPVQPNTLEGNRAGWVAGSIVNPVEVCCPDNLCCFTPVNITRVCMVTNPAGGQLDPIIFVRSRIVDKHGRKYITPTGNDPFVQFLK